MANKIKVASFFSGIGGFDLGFERAGMEIVFQVEKDAFCKEVLKKHWPNVQLHEDINDLHVNEIPEATLWCGGFPCQDLSLAHQGRREGLNGKRSGLFFRFAELIKGGRPKWIVIENVPGLLNSNEGNDFKVLLQTLDEFGYGISWRVLDAKYFGTPQRRRRVFIVGSLGTLLSAKVLFEPGRTTITRRSGLGKKEAAAKRLSPGNGNSKIYSIQHAAIGRKHSAGPQAKGYRNDGETYTLDSRGSADAVCSTINPFRIRKITGIPTGVDRRRQKAVGNAVAVPVSEWIGRRLVKVDREMKK